MKIHGHGSGHMVKAVLRACDLISAFRGEGELLALRDLGTRTALPRATVYRLIRTLESRGFVERMPNQRYRVKFMPLRHRRWRIGYAALGSAFALTREITEGVVEAAAAEEAVELIVLDNQNSSRTALANAQRLVKERVDLAVEYQSDERIAPKIAATFLEANIPFIAVNFPHPGAIYYGADNYQAGLLAGRHLGSWARHNWRGVIGELLLIGLPDAGPFVNLRLAGILAGLKDVLPAFEDYRAVHLEARGGGCGPSMEVIRKHLRHCKANQVAVGAISDTVGLGALRALEEGGRTLDYAVVGQSACLEARVELRRPGTRLIGSVGYFPEKYGEGIIALAIRYLGGQPVPPAVLTKHHVIITPETVEHFYPNDALVANADLSSLLLRTL
jgi:ribose transport system substrate-binding protein